VSDRRQHQPFGGSFVGLIGPGHRGSGLLGDVKSWIDALADYAVELGLDTFIIWPKRYALDQLEVFASEVRAGRPPARERTPRLDWM